MTVKIRKQIYIEPYQEALLKKKARKTGVSEAEIIRQAIDQHIRAFQAAARDNSAWQEEDVFIRGLMALGPVAGGRTWTRDELYER